MGGVALAGLLQPQHRIAVVADTEGGQRLKICVGSVHLLIRQGVLPATQLMPSTPWKVPVAALDTEPVKTGVLAIMARRPRNYPDLQALTTPRLFDL
jgi:hypothetical protein